MHMQMFWEEDFQKIYWKLFMFAIHIIVQPEVRACIKIPSVQPQWNLTQHSLMPATHKTKTVTVSLVKMVASLIS